MPEEWAKEFCKDHARIRQLRAPRADDEPSTYEDGNEDFQTVRLRDNAKQQEAISRERRVFATLRQLLPSQVAQLPWTAIAARDGDQETTLTDVAQFLRLYNSSRTEIISAVQLWMHDSSSAGFLRACEHHDWDLQRQDEALEAELGI